MIPDILKGYFAQDNQPPAKSPDEDDNRPTILTSNRHAMVDLETLGVPDGADTPAVFQIGLVLFNPNALGIEGFILDRHLLECHPLLAIAAGYQWTPGTVRWHQEKGTLPTRCSLNDLQKIVCDAHHILTHWDFDFIWAKSPDFDLRILGELFSDHALEESPWQYWQARDVRTITDPFRDDHDWPDPTHNALADAELQVAQVRDALSRILNTAPPVLSRPA